MLAACTTRHVAEEGLLILDDGCLPERAVARPTVTVPSADTLSRVSIRRRCRRPREVVGTVDYCIAGEDDPIFRQPRDPGPPSCAPCRSGDHAMLPVVEDQRVGKQQRRRLQLRVAHILALLCRRCPNARAGRRTGRSRGASSRRARRCGRRRWRVHPHLIAARMVAVMMSIKAKRIGFFVSSRILGMTSRAPDGRSHRSRARNPQKSPIRCCNVPCQCPL